MKRERRNKQEIERMESDCRYYLMYNRYDAHKAYDSMIKDHLLSGNPTPYYIKGIKDFIKIAEIMKVERQEKEREKQQKEEYKEQQQNTIDKILNISVESFITAYKQAKETGIEKHKMALCDMATLKYAGELKEKYITYYYIGLFDVNR